MSGLIHVAMRAVVWVSAVLTVFVITPIVYMMADTQKPYEYISGEIVPYVVLPGQIVTVKWRLKINRKCRGVNQRQIADSTGRIVNYDPVIATGSNVSEEFSIAFEIPHGLAPGPAKYRVLSSYTCNLMQSILWPLHVTTPDVPFVVAVKSTPKHH
jgi:hypothetical protein